MLAALKALSRAAPVRPELSGLVPSSNTVLSPAASHIYSLPARWTPRGRTTCPALLSKRLPETCSPLLVTVAACTRVGACHVRPTITRLNTTTIKGRTRRFFFFTSVVLAVYGQFSAAIDKRKRAFLGTL